MSVLLLCQEIDLTLPVRHLPRKLNIMADTLARSRRPVLTEWTLNASIFEALRSAVDKPYVALFATALNHRLPSDLCGVSSGRDGLSS